MISVPRPSVFPRGSLATVKEDSAVDSLRNSKVIFFFNKYYLISNIPDILLVVIILRDDSHFICNEINRVKSNSELTYETNICAFRQRLQELFGTYNYCIVASNRTSA